MTRKQAQKLMDDLGQDLTPQDYCEQLYVSIPKVGTTVFKDCVYHEAENITLVWTLTDRFIIDKNDLGEAVIIPYNQSDSIVSLNTKVT